MLMNDEELYVFSLLCALISTAVEEFSFSSCITCMIMRLRENVCEWENKKTQ